MTSLTWTPALWISGAAVAAWLAAMLVLLAVRRWARRDRAAGAQIVEVLAPPRLDYPTALAAAARFWRDLAGLARPSWSRLLHGEPHLGVEIHTTSQAVSTRLWIPAGLHPARIDAAARAAWPGALTVVLGPAHDYPPLPEAGVSAGAVVDFGPSRPGRFGLGWFGGDHRDQGFSVLHVPDGAQDDPLRALESLGGFLPPAEHAVIQLLARPASPRRRRRYRRQLSAALSGRRRAGVLAVLGRELSGGVCEVLDLVSGHSTARQPYHSGAQYPRRNADPVRAEELRAARAKAAGPLWEITARCAAASSDTGLIPTHRVAEIVAILFGAFALFGAATPVTRRPLRHPARVLAAREISRGVLVSVPELAALAHLPTPTPALSGWRTRPVLPPPQHTHPVPATGDNDE